MLADGKSALIPGPGHSRKDRSVSLRQMPDGRILIYCFSPNDDWRDVQAMLQASGAEFGAAIANTSSERQVRACSESKVLRAHKIWMRATPVRGTCAETYLRARGLRASSWPSTLRYLPGATSLEDKRRRPALIAAITTDQGDLQGVQITLLTPCGTQKAALETPRRIIGKLSGGAVRLYDGPAQGKLIVAEGVETALSASEALVTPAWSALTAGNLARFDPPGWVGRLVIAADRGQAGEAAAETLAHRMAKRNLSADIAFAPDNYPDWNDWARRTP